MPETELKVKIYGDLVLRKKARPVKDVGPGHAKVLSRMSRIMYAESGIGLAAPQVGVQQSLIVADIGTGLFKLINPVIVKKEGKQTNQEGCLSVPGVCIKVTRAKKITLKALDDTGKQVELKAQDLLACVFQHEIDHLQGKLIVDYASVLERFKIKKALAQLRKKTLNERLSESEAESGQLQL
jgi:peptide deformylase